MANFGLEIEKDKGIEYINFVNKGLKVKNLVENPFKGSISPLLDEDNKDYYLINITPVYPKVYLFGLLTSLGVFLFAGLTLWLLPGLFLFSLGFFWSKYFYYLMFKIGFKKKGYSGKIRLLNNDELFNRCSKCIGIII